MTNTSLLGELKSLLFLTFASWRHKISTVNTASDPKLKMLAEQELKEVEAVIGNVFDLNMTCFLREMAEKDLFTDLILLAYGYEAVNDMFLRGIILDFLESRPSLPTDIFSRASLHTITFFVKSQDMTWQDARQRVGRTEELRSQASDLYDTILERGRIAYREGGDRHLIWCHGVAARAAGAEWWPAR